jgi:Ca2+-binding RTX toxin-like protein
MAITTNGLQLTRLAGAAFNQQLSASDYSEILAANKTAAELDAWANAAVAAEFRNKTTTDIAKAVLENVGLSSVAGLEAWVAGQLNAGGGVAKAGASLLAMLNDYSNMSTTEAIYGASVVTFNQKTSNSQVLSQTAGTTTGTYAAVSTATPSTPFTLTTGVDLKTTGAGADTFTSVNPASATATLTAGDNIDGGAGVDTLNITSAAAMTLGAGVTMNNVENVSISASGDTLILDTALMTGITSVTNSGSTAAVSVSGLKALVPVSVTASTANTTVTFAAAVTAGTADAITVNLNGANSSGGGTSIVSVAGFETVNVTSSGSASGASTTGNTGVTIDSTTLTTLNVTGSTAAKLVANLVGASASVTGTVTSDDGAHDVNISGRFLTDKLSISMSGGNDQVRTDTVAATHTIAGGDGTDTLRYSGTAAVALAATANVTGFETVTLSGPASFAMAGAGVTTVNYTTAASGTFGGLSTGGTIGLNVGGSMTAAAAGAAATATSTAIATAATYSGTADSLTVNVGLATTSAGVAASSVSALGVESVTINNLSATGGTEPRTVTFNDTTATTGATKSITVTSAGTGLITTVFTPTGTQALTSVNMAGVTGNSVFASGTTLVGMAITGGVGSDSLTGGAAADTILGGEGNDVLGGGAGADSIDGGNGTNSITGGSGADTMTGGTGVDTYVFASNATTAATPVLTSTASAPDTITNFTTGTDKISITGTLAPTKYVGTFNTLQAALAAQASSAQAGGASFITGESTLYVFQNTDGTLNVNDMVIKLPGVTVFGEGDLFLGSNAGGSAITSASNSTTVLNVTLTNAPVGTSNSPVLNTTDLNDTVGANTTNIASATLTGGLGSDSITLVNSSTTAAAYTVSLGSLVTGFESITLPNAVGASTITLAAANVAVGTTFVVNGSAMAGLDVNGAAITTNNGSLRVDGALVASTGRLNITGGAGPDSLTGGAGNDTITGGAGNDSITAGTGNDSIEGGDGDDTITGGAGADVINGGAGNDAIANAAAGSTIDGGAGTDTITTTVANLLGSTFIGNTGVADALTITYSGTASEIVTLADTAVSGAAAGISGIETVNAVLGAATQELTLPSGFSGAVVFTGAFAEVLNSSGGTVSVTQLGGETLALTGTSAYTVIPGATGAVSSTGTGSLTVTAIATETHTISSSTASSVVLNAAALAGGSVLTFGGTSPVTVNGLGTAALTGVGGVIEANTHTSGATTVNLAGTNIATITLDALGTGLVTINDAGTTTSLTTLVTTGTASRTINVNLTGATGYFAVTAAAGQNPINITATTGAHSITGGSGADIIVSSAGNDSIIGGAGADKITLGGGVDFLTVATADTSLVTGVATAAVLTAALVPSINVSGCDIITGFIAGDSIKFVQGAASTVNTTAYAIVTNNGTLGANTTNDLASLRGNYDSASGVFTLALGGTSTFLGFDTTGIVASGTTYAGVVLVGYVDTGAVDTWIGESTTGCVYLGVA